MSASELRKLAGLPGVPKPAAMPLEKYGDAYDAPAPFDADFRHSWCADRADADLSSGEVACGCGMVSCDPCPCHWDPTIRSLCESAAIERENGISDGEAVFLRHAFADAVARPWREEPALDEKTITALLRECVTVVRPGEVLVILADDSWTPNQTREIQDAFEHIVEYKGWQFEILFVPGSAVASRAETVPAPDSLDNFWALPVGVMYYPTRATAPTMALLCEALEADGILTPERSRSLSGLRPLRTWHGPVPS